MYLGIDTSCYTSSVAIVDDDGEIITDKRIPLTVKAGGKGLRQSEGVFMHLKNMPLLLEEISEFMPFIKAVAYSKTPRREENSYMPVFVAGSSFARAVASAKNIPVFDTTHQEGHISAVLETTDNPCENFIAVHISGGTTEITRCRADEHGYETEIIGKTLDIPAGQLIDRIGVLAGLEFPCGREMDEIAQKGSLRLPVTAKEGNINFSGAETAAKRFLEQGCENSELFYAVFECIAKSLEKAISKFNINTIIMAGGVSANSIIREHLTKAFGKKIIFARPMYSTDNAVGTAYICKRKCRIE